MKEVKKKIEVKYSQGKLKEKFLRLLSAKANGGTPLVGQSKPYQDSLKESRSVTLNADRAKATALMEWQKHRRLSQIL